MHDGAGLQAAPSHGPGSGPGGAYFPRESDLTTSTVGMTAFEISVKSSPIDGSIGVIATYSHTCSVLRFARVQNTSKVKVLPNHSRRCEFPYPPTFRIHHIAR